MWGTEHLSLTSDFGESLKCEWELRGSSECKLRIPKSTDDVIDAFLEISVTSKILSNVILFTILTYILHKETSHKLHFIFMLPVFFVF